MAGHTKINLKLVHTDGANGGRHKASVLFADRMARYSNGECAVNVTHFGASDDLSALNSLQDGTVDFALASAGIFGELVEPLNLTALPYLVDTYEQGWALYDQSTWLKQQFGRLTEKGIRSLATWEAGFRSFTTTTPLRSPDAARGLKMRTFKNVLIKKIMNTLEFEPVIMGISEVYDSIETGMIDGQENPIDTIFSQRFYKVAPHLTMTRHIYGPLPFCISERTWQALAPHHQEAVAKAAIDASEFSRRMVRNLEDFQINEIRIKGTKIFYPDVNEWRKALHPVYDWALKNYPDVKTLLSEAADLRQKTAA